MTRAADIERIDLGLVNRCNLRCPLCPYVKRNIPKIQKPAHANFDEVSAFLDKLPNIRVAIVEGNFCEPTLYRHFKQMITYLKQRNIRIRLSTNGNTFSPDWWADIGPLFRSEDVIRFAIEGSTQELHSKYRIGGVLEEVLANHRAFKQNSCGTTLLQNIIFQYNHHDQDNIKQLFLDEGFDFIGFQRCYPSENLKPDDGLAPVPQVLRYYKMYERVVQSRQIHKPVILCDSDNRNEIYINHLGQVFRCGIHDEDRPYDIVPTVLDDVDYVFDQITFATNNRHNCNSCITNCNSFCYKLGDIYPDYIIDRDMNVYEENYFSAAVESPTYWNRDKLI